ncbi:hypothetical protein [Paenibacillus sp. LPE1-1-1.1]|uniref:AbiJ-related protein n=1 Tax=Paenibacillus sp. LPE1-1-1.1 TaxID=3135230 RepID=UPI0034217EA5
MATNITRLTRQYLMDELFSTGLQLDGRLDFITFLYRTWPLDQMNSTDSRFITAEEDICQHIHTKGVGKQKKADQDCIVPVLVGFFDAPTMNTLNTCKCVGLYFSRGFHMLV